MTSTLRKIFLPSDGTARLRLTMVLSIALSIGGILCAKLYGVSADGGRGGALAVAVSFFTLFMGRNTPEDAMQIKIEDATSDPLKAEVTRHRNALASMLDWQAKEKIYLTISSLVGTITWGFGDIVAAWLGAPTQ